MVQTNTLKSLKERFSEVQDKNGLNNLWKLCFLLFDTEFQPEPQARQNSVDQILLNFKNLSKDSLSSQLSTLQVRDRKCKFYWQEFWDLCGYEDPDVVLLRFLFARKLVLVDAFKMLLDCLVWRGFEFKTTALMRTGEQGINQALLKSGEVYFRGTDLHGRLLVYINVAKHDKSIQTLEEGKKFIIFTMETGKQLLSPGTENFTIVFNMTKFSISNVDLASISFTMKSLVSFYPESLGSCLIVNAPFIFQGFYKVICGLGMDPVVKSKIKFIKSCELPNYIPSKFIPSALGGADQSKYEYLSPPISSKPSFNEARIKELEDEREQLIEKFCRYSKKIAFSDGFDIGEEDLAEKAKAMEEFRANSKEYFYEAFEPNHYQRTGILSDKNQTINWN